MYLEKVLIDYLDPVGLPQEDGSLVTWRVLPEQDRSVIVDKLKDVTGHREDDTAGIRFYNSEACRITKHELNLPTISIDKDGKIQFGFEHLGVPLSKEGRGTKGLYHLLLPPGYRMTDIYLVDPFDYENESMRDLDWFYTNDSSRISVGWWDFSHTNEFEYNIYWDEECDTQFIELPLQSQHGEFSFIVAGEAEPYQPDLPDTHFVSSKSGSVGQLIHRWDYATDEEGKRKVTDNICEAQKRLVLQPQVFGVGVNLNVILEDAIDKFAEKFGD